VLKGEGDKAFVFRRGCLAYEKAALERRGIQYYEEIGGRASNACRAATR